MVTTFYPPYHFGGDAIFIRRLVHALARRGHEVEVLHDADAWRILSPEGEPSALAEPPGVRVHRLESRIPALSCLATQQLGRPLVHGRRIRRILDEGHFDVIQFHNISLVGGPGVLSCGDAIKLYMAHEHWLVCPTHVLWRHGRELCEERQCIRCALHYRRPPQLWRYTGLLEREARHVDVFASPSRWSARKHRELGFPRELEVIPYFLPDPGSEGELPPSPPPPRPYFLFVGRLEKIKGLQELIPHFAGPGETELWVAGSGDYEGVLRRQAKDLPRVRFLGSHRPEELRGLYRQARALVAPSLCYETFGIVLLEAFREGTPVIARRRGPFTEIVEGSGGGLLFESSEELAAALTTFQQEPRRAREMGQAGQRALHEHWSEGVVLEQYFEVIRRVARHKRPELARRMEAAPSAARAGAAT